MDRFLKTFTNSGSFGVFVEMIRKPLRADRPAELAVYGREGGGSYAFADTDSMAIVANESGGLVPCEGGSHRMPDARSAIRVLSWEEVNSIVNRFESLNPYDRTAVRRSILKIEDVNIDPETGKRRQIHAFAISAKRYALFTIEADRRPVILEAKEHGLGQYLNPIDPEREDRDWIPEMWEGIVGEALGGSPFQPPWGDQPAMIRSAISTPALLDRFTQLNRKKAFADQLKPFNFFLSAPVDTFDRPAGVRESHLIAPYSPNPADWLRSWWVDAHSGDRYRIRTNGPTNRFVIRVQTIADVINRFRMNPESKSAGPGGSPSNRATIGLLGRLHVRAFPVFHIGKETNLLDQQVEGVLLTNPQAVYLGEGDLEAIRSQLQSVSIAKVADLSGVSPRMLRDIRQGTRRPSAKRLGAITAALAQMLDEAEG
jgi:hypothetical protein